MKEEMSELSLVDESKYLVTFVNSIDTTSKTEVEANSEKEAKKKVKDLFGREVYRIISAEKVSESAVTSAVNKILEGFDVRGILTELRSESKLEGNRVIVNIDPKYRDNFNEKLKKCYVLPEVIMESDERLQIVFPSEDDIRSKFNVIMKDVINYVE